MNAAKTLALVTEIWIYFVLLSASFGSSTIAKMSNKENPGFISIDCGVDADYFDEDAGIYFKSDSEFVSSGKNQITQTGYVYNIPYFGKQLQNLRSFEEGTRNCYTLKPEQGGQNYLIRASSFNFWEKVDFTIGTWWLYEILHFSSSDTIDVCLINTGNGGVPFISALELRLVNSSSYIGQSYSTLETIWRSDVGYKNTNAIRYKDDPYDRLWLPMDATHGYDNDWGFVNSPMLDIGMQENIDNNKVPVEVFRTAALPGANQSSLSYNYKDEPWYDLYVNLYFLEIEKILPGQRRKFKVTINGDDYGAFTLENSKPLTIRSNKCRGVVNFSINRTKDSTLPPILNAFEIFRERNLSNPTTNQTDVDAIMAIKQVYKINKIDWQGDPCLPPMNLSSSSLRGEIASAFSNLRAMQNLDLSFNELTGTVPEFLGQLPNLNVLFDGNPKLSLTAPFEKTKKHLILPIVVSIVAILVFLVLSIMIIIWIMKRTEFPKAERVH
ncbi:hypothetical protein K2173_024451 [Erythroxylum novogranatense]|uniref:Malectin-like domain-containing protein n=1 Tax=Erythroxylum novogranatense TaxID=1862640 RepID=A0AAV8SUE1_9ROSI|nr:hypothetical protein K2173_024451 [Erythroxylum novogranatense]